MDTKPKEITIDEWREIVEIAFVREAWGLYDIKLAPEEFAKSAYGAKFDFVSGSPGYCGDLYIIYGDALSGKPVLIIRNSETADEANLKGHLEVVEEN